MIGTSIGPYRITAKLGAGGMGEVYRARDTKLDRDVAIKILPDSFAHDAERVARFEREAKVLAALNHPNIAQIYGLEERALVMELVEGPTLAERIAQGALPLDEALNIAKQIAEALEAAHEKGITHRDLKPANVKLRPDGTVKVLDFGLATAAQSTTAEGNPSISPTLTLDYAATRTGMIMGTAAYMSPEQASGKPVDKRSDIWSFGVVLWEMLTGKRLFEGETISHVMAAVLTKEPDLKAVPVKVRTLLQRCLDRDVKTRLRDIGEAWFLLEQFPAKSEPSKKSKLPWVLAGALAILAVVLGAIAWRATRPVEHPLMRFSVDLGPEAMVGASITATISPDGSRIVFPVRDPDGMQMLATRLLNQATPTLLSGTDGGADPFFSPDSQWIGFFADGKLKKISVLGGAALTLCDAPDDRGGSWGGDGNIIAALNSTAETGLSRVPASGGTPQALTNPHDEGEYAHRWPKFLPGGNAVLFTGSPSNGAFDEANIEVLSLKTGKVKILVRGGYFPAYLPTNASTGHLVYVHDGVLFGVPFDPVRLELHGTSAPLLEDVAANAGSGGGQFDVSRTGTLAYLSGKSSTPGWPVVWLESSGKTQPLLAKPGTYSTPRLSPDGNILALAVSGAKGEDLYVYDWQHDTMSRLTFTGRSNTLPVWTPDSKHIAFAASDGLWWVRADGAGEPQQLLKTKNLLFGNSFSPDGKLLSYAELSPETRNDIWTLPLDLSDPDHPKPGKPEPFLRTPASEGFGNFSPDARWMAYTSDESGQLEVYVRPFPGPGGKWQISTGGGTVPEWSSDGRKLFYVTLDSRIMVTEYMTKGNSFSYARPRVWTNTQINVVGGANRYFDIHPDGKRFAVFPRPEASNEKQGNVRVTFLLNFFDELRRRVPVSK